MLFFLQIFECFFKIRANSLFHLGFSNQAEGNALNFSAYLAVDHEEGDESHVPAQSGNESPVFNQGNSPGAGGSHGRTSPQPGGTQIQPVIPQPIVTYMSLRTACKLVVSSLRKEKDWKVLELILKEIPHVMENKALILSKHGNDIDFLANALCSMVKYKRWVYFYTSVISLV